MIKRLALLAAAGMLATACASSSAPAGAIDTTTGAVSLTGSAAAGTATVANLATTTHWVAEERLMPEDPLLALVNAAATDADNPAGVLVKCNAANGNITMRVGKQASSRVGQSATYRIRTGGEAREVNGKFEVNTKSADADFVFPVTSADLMGMAQLDMVSIISDQGETQWAFVKDPAAPAQAKYVGSMKDLGTATRDFLTYCNPK